MHSTRIINNYGSPVPKPAVISTLNTNKTVLNVLWLGKTED